jgi:hypothetical protein
VIVEKDYSRADGLICCNNFEIIVCPARSLRDYYFLYAGIDYARGGKAEEKSTVGSLDKLARI